MSEIFPQRASKLRLVYAKVICNFELNTCVSINITSLIQDIEIGWAVNWAWLVHVSYLAFSNLAIVAAFSIDAESF